MHQLKCTECDKNTDGLTTCYLDNEVKGHLCPDCMEYSGYCLMCGHFSVGKGSFELQPDAAYCDDCLKEISEQADIIIQDIDPIPAWFGYIPVEVINNN